MSQVIIPKKSTVADKIPLTTDLQAGEICINLTDGIVYAKHTDGSIVNLTGALELHTHTISQVDNLQTTLDTKLDAGSVKLRIGTLKETVSVTSGQTIINLTQIEIPTSHEPLLFLEGYNDSLYINNFTVTSPTQITLSSPIENDGTLYVSVHVMTYYDKDAPSELEFHETDPNAHPQYLSDAPNDGSSYVRNSGIWESLSVSGDLSYTNGVISFNETYSTANEILTSIQIVDGTGSGLDADLLDGQHAAAFQPTLVSGTNIKTINSQSILGSGDLVLESGSSVNVSDTAPLSPSDGDLWWDSSEGELYIYYDDGTSAQWVTSVSPLAGPKGETGTINVGTTTTSNPGTLSDVVNSGTEYEAILDFTIPRGSTVDVGSTTTGAPGTSASVSDSGTNGDVVLDFTIPRGDKGEKGDAGNFAEVTDMWYSTADAVERFYFVNNSHTYIRSDGNITFRNAANTDTTVIDASGNLVATGDVTAYSDERLKENIETIPDALYKVGQLNGYTFNRIDVEERHTGLIAQEVLEVLPEAVMGGPTEDDPDGKYSVAYGNMVGLLVQAIKEQQEQIDELKRRLG